MLDITQGIKELKMVSQIHIVAVNNEVKELLWLLQKDNNKAIEIKTINIDKQESQKFNYRLKDSCTPKFSLPEKYLYVPNAAIMKSGAFNLVSERYSINKLHQNSHLYTSTNLKEFPGRRFLIKRVYNFNKKELKELKTIKKANISTRNFPESVANLRKKLKINENKPNTIKNFEIKIRFVDSIFLIKIEQKMRLRVFIFKFQLMLLFL